MALTSEIATVETKRHGRSYLRRLLPRCGVACGRASFGGSRRPHLLSASASCVGPWASRLIAFLLFGAVLLLLLAPISDALDGHEYLHGNDAELTLSIFMCVATAAFWVRPLAESCRTIVRRALARAIPASDFARLVTNIGASVLTASPPLLSPLRI